MLLQIFMIDDDVNMMLIISKFSFKKNNKILSKKYIYFYIILLKTMKKIYFWNENHTVAFRKKYHWTIFILY